jgi:hypothetical protein
VVSAITGDGVYCFAVDSLSTDNVIYNAREAAAGRPELLLAVGTGCTPTTCAAQGKNCGTISNGCGGTLTCRSCTAPQTCGGGGVANVCGVVPAAVTVTVLADAAVDSTLPTANLGTAVQLNVDAGPAVKHTFLRVQVSNVAGRVITAARLNLTAATTTNAQSVAGGQIHPVASCTWGETTITWDNQPAIAAGVLSSLGAVAQGQAVSFDLAGAITGDGTYCFAIDSSSTDGVDYNAREASSGRPALVLTTTP